jgi:hypothetical protein
MPCSDITLTARTRDCVWSHIDAAKLTSVLLLSAILHVKLTDPGRRTRHTYRAVSQLDDASSHAFGTPVSSIRPPDLVVCRNFNDLEGNMMAPRGGAPGLALEPIPIAFLKRSIDDWIIE